MKIIVVDDDATFRARLVAALAERAMQASAAASPQEARQIATRLQPDRAIVDLRMPGGSGLEVVTDLLSIKPDMQIVVLTGYGSIATAIEATRRGAIDYLTKPASADQILAAFEKKSSPLREFPNPPALHPSLELNGSTSSESSPTAAETFLTPRASWEFTVDRSKGN